MKQTPNKPDVKDTTSNRPVRGKYADAFKQGVDVVIHHENHDQHSKVKRSDDGTFEWTPPRPK